MWVLTGSLPSTVALPPDIAVEALEVEVIVQFLDEDLKQDLQAVSVGWFAVADLSPTLTPS